MKTSPESVIRLYLSLTLLNTLAASFIWGINTLFLLDAGLSNTAAFAANAFFTAGQVIFEVPTGVVADTQGRRVSFILGTITLSISTLLYLWMWKISGPFWGWALSSVFLGLGFTFFSGATEAWLVDALKATKAKQSVDSVLAKGQIVVGIGMLCGSVAGGVIAQYSNLAVPYIIRTVILLVSFVVALLFMFDIGFKPKAKESLLSEVKEILAASIHYGLKQSPACWIMLAAPFTAGVGIYVFYALQPFLLQLYGSSTAYSVAGSVAAIVALAQIAGGISVSYLSKIFSKRTTVLIAGTTLNIFVLLAIGLTSNFWLVIILIVMWALIFSAILPIRQSFLNSLIPSEQRATVLSFDSLMGSSGGVVFQPMLGKVADVYSYSISYLVSGLLYCFALPFLLLAKRVNVKSDQIKSQTRIVKSINK